MRPTGTLLALALWSAFAHAQSVSQTFTLDGKLYSDTAGTTPLTQAGVVLTIQVLNQAEDCILYEETNTVDTSATDGNFTVQVGSATLGASAAKRGANDTGNAMSTVYSNSSVNVTGKALSGGAACFYNPVAGDHRYLRIVVQGSGAPQVLSPNMVLDSVPMAAVADTLQGLGPTNLVKVNTTAPANVSQANVENIFSTTNYPRLVTMLSTAPSNYLQTGANGSIAIPAVANQPGAGLTAGQVWYDSVSNTLKYYDGTTVRTMIGSGGGSTDIQTAGNITATGNGTTTGVITAPTISSNLSSTNKLRVYKTGNANYVELQSPASLASNLIFYLPITTGASGDSLRTDGAGQLYWAPPNNGTVTSITAGTGLSGGTITGIGTVALANTAVTPASYGSATQVATFTVDQQGRLTAAGNTTISGVAPGGAAGGDLTGNYPGPTIAAGAVTAGKIADGGVVTSKMFANPGVGRLVVTDAATGAGLSALSCAAGEVLVWNAGTGWTCTAQSALTITSATNFSGSLVGDVTGTQGATVVSAVAGSTAANVHAAELLANAATSANTNSAIMKRDASGNFAGSAATLTSVILKDGGVKTATLQAPNAITTSYALKLPIALGSNGQVLSTDATGQLSWVNAPAAPGSDCPGGQVLTYTSGAFSCVVDQTSGGGTGITTFNGETGGTQGFGATTNAGTAITWTSASNTHTLNIPMAHTATVAAGLISKAEFDVFNGKQNALGYTPLDPANNLSDVANAGTARTNLGLGTAATKDFPAAGDAAAAQVVLGNDSRLTNSRAPSGTAGGELAGTYPNPTIATGAVTTVKMFANPGVGRIVATDGTTGASLTPLACAAGQLLTWNASNGWVCTDANTLATSTSASFSGSLSGDVTGTQGATVVSAVGGSTAANVHAAELLANAATSANTNSAIMKRDGSGNFAASAATVTSVIYKDTGANTVTVKAPASVSSSYTLNWPTGVAGTAGQVLTSDTSGNLSWTTTAVSNSAGLATGKVWLGDAGGQAQEVTAATNFVLNGGQAGAVTLGPSNANALTMQTGGSARVTVDSTGNVGIGTTSPAYNLDIQMNTTGGIQVTDSDAPGSQLFLGEGGSGAATFYPTIVGYSVGANRFTGMYATVKAAEDTGSVPALVFASRQTPNADLATRPLFEWRNNATPKMTMLASGNVGIGTTNPGLNKVQILEDSTNVNGAFGLYALASSTITANGTYYNQAVFGNHAKKVASGVTDSGYLVGIHGSAMRNYSTTSDNGTLDAIYGGWLQYGHYNSDATATPLTTNAYGLFITPYHTRGTITNMYDLYLGSPVTGGTATNRWNIYQAEAAGKSYFAGSVGIGTTNPVSKLDVNGTITATGFSGPITSSVVSAGNGTVGAPSLTFSSELDTGWWRPAADTMAASTAGAERIRIGSTGNVGIGSTNPGTLLDIKGSSDQVQLAVRSNATQGNYLAGFYDSSNALALGIWASGLVERPAAINTDFVLQQSANKSITFRTNGSNERMRIDGSGNVGIGTTNPGAKLEVAGSIYSNPSPYNIGNLLGADSGGTMRLLVAVSNSFTNATVLQSAGGGILLRDSSQVPRLAITEAGNVGIGTTNPAAKLDVNGTIFATDICDETGANCKDISAGWGGGGSTFGAGTTGAPSITFTADTDTGWWNPGANLLAASTAGVERIRIGATGNVGIGTSNPSGKLDIEGGDVFIGTGTLTNASGSDDLSVTGNLEVDGTIYGNGSGLTSVTPGADVVDFSHIADSMTLDASTVINATGTNVLSINNTGTGNSFLINDVGSDTTPFVVDASGNVAIGTTTAANKLQVVGTGTGYGMRIDNTTNGDGLEIFTANATGNNGIMWTQGASVIFNLTSNAANEGMLRLYDSGTETVNLNANGNSFTMGTLSVGTASNPTPYALHVVGDVNATGGFRDTGTCVAGTCLSDARLKKNIENFDYGLTDLLRVRPRIYQLNGLGGLQDGTVEVGFIAQEMEKAIPSLVVEEQVKMRPGDTEKTTVKAVNYSRFIFIVINSVQELYAKWFTDHQRIDELEKENKEMKAEIQLLKERLGQLEAR